VKRQSLGRVRPRRTRLAVAAAAGVLAVLAAGCSNTTGGSGGGSSPAASGSGSAKLVTAASVNQQLLAATIKKALLAPVPVSQLDPVVADTLAVASQPLTAAQNTLLATCLHQNSCETGHGSLTIGINADSQDNPWWNIRRAETTAQAIAYPQVKRIIYTSANSDIAQALANLRSLIAQRVDIIVEDPEFGAAVLPAVRQARQAGIVVVTENSPIPSPGTSGPDVQIPYDLCAMGTTAATTMAKASGSGPKTYGLYTGIPGNSDAAEWQPCAQRALKGLGWTQVAQGYTQWTQQGEAQAANALLASGKNVRAIFYDSGVDDFLKPYIAAHKTPPAAFTDTLWYSFFPIYQDAKSASLNPEVFVSNGHVWYGRMAVTAGVMLKTGQHVPKKVVAPVPVVPFTQVLYLNVPGMPANTPLPTLLTPAQAQMALAAS
jgi:ABC-type sugar transport system substrate-binding protein